MCIKLSLGGERRETGRGLVTRVTGSIVVTEEVIITILDVMDLVTGAPRYIIPRFPTTITDADIWIPTAVGDFQECENR